MKHLQFLVSLTLLLTIFSCSTPTDVNIDIVPLPGNLKQLGGEFEITSSTSIIIIDKELMPLANLLNDQLNKLSGFRLEIDTEVTDGNIFLKLDTHLDKEEYQLEVTDNITLTAANYNGLAKAMASLVQLISKSTIKYQLYLPKVTITDKPDFEYRAVMLDLARFWHPVETLKETINLLWYYKINYLHLHLSDNRRFTLPLEAFPKLKTINKLGEREYYTKEELTDLVKYAKERGIIIIPEIDLPGHSAALWRNYPNEFGSIDPETNEPMNLYVINMVKEETYDAIETMIEELASIFHTSPFIHVGGDEVYLENIKKVPGYDAYVKKHNLKAAEKGDANELFCHFINRLNKMVKHTGKQTIVWEGFHNTGAGNIVIDKDIKVIVWNTTYNNPKKLIDNGYNIVNSTWIPWYMVGAMNLAPTPKKGYYWNVTDWSHWNKDIQDVKLESNSGILGGQLSFWEQNYYKVVPVLRERVPVLSERLWSNSAPSDYKGFVKRYLESDNTYKDLFQPVKTSASNLLQDEDLRFQGQTNIELSSSLTGKIKYVYSEFWGIPDMTKALDYERPVSINRSGVLTAQLFDKSDEKIGSPIQWYYQKIAPAYKYKVFGPAPNTGWDIIPDFSKLDVMREGVTGKMTPERLEKINGELFAKVNNAGHIETRFNGIYNQYAVELQGSLIIDSTSTFTFRIQTHDGLAELFIDNQLVAQGKEFKNQPEDFIVNLQKGQYNFTIKYYYRQIQNHLSIMYKTEEMKDFLPFENLVTPLVVEE